MIIKSTTGYESYTLSVIIISSYGTTRMQVSGVLQKGTNLMKVAAEIPKKQASYVQALLKWSQFKIVQGWPNVWRVFVECWSNTLDFNDLPYSLYISELNVWITFEDAWASWRFETNYFRLAMKGNSVSGFTSNPLTINYWHPNIWILCCNALSVTMQRKTTLQ